MSAPDGLTIATKGGLVRPGPDQWVESGRPEHLRRACEGSLRRLKVQRIDLYQLHRIDPAVPVGDQLGTLKDLRTEGKIRHVGLSEVSVAQIEHAHTILPIVSVQNRYSVADRQSEDVLEYCEREGMGFLPWYPLAAGSLARRGPVARVAKRFMEAVGHTLTKKSLGKAVPVAGILVGGALNWTSLEGIVDTADIIFL